MNAENRITLKKAAINDPELAKVIKFSIGDPNRNKILDVIKKL